MKKKTVNKVAKTKADKPQKNKLEILAIIPARGGSKSIPRKNIKLLAGKPLIGWKVEAAKKSKLITRIIISTDDQEIADVAKSFGAEIPFLRPKEIAQDLSTDVEFIDHALTFLKEKEGYVPDIVLRLPPTSPLCNEDHIDEGIEKLLSTPGADSVRPITEAPKHPYKMWRISDDKSKLVPFLSKEVTGFDEPQNMPRQLFPKVYVHTGGMDVLWRKTIEEQRSTSGKHVAYFHMKPEDSVNIDYPIDFEIAEILMRKKQGPQN
jgi:N-acylneuraminate cytidylyltransferase